MPFDGPFCSSHVLQVAAVGNGQVRHAVVKLPLERREVREGCVREPCQGPEGLGIVRREPENLVANHAVRVS